MLTLEETAALEAHARILAFIRNYATLHHQPEFRAWVRELDGHDLMTFAIIPDVEVTDRVRVVHDVGLFARARECLDAHPRIQRTNYRGDNAVLVICSSQ